MKFCENHNCEVHINAINTGASNAVGRGKKNNSFERHLKRSAAIWNAPFRPIRTGPIRFMTYAKIFRSVKATKSNTRIDNNAIINPVSLINLL